MPLIVDSFRGGLPADGRASLARVYAGSPEFSSGEAALLVLEEALEAGEGTLYAGLFNSKFICALLAQGAAPQRQLRYLCVHPANRHRGIARRLFDEVRRLEAARGTESLEAVFDLQIDGVPEMLVALGFTRGSDAETFRRVV